MSSRVTVAQRILCSLLAVPCDFDVPTMSAQLAIVARSLLCQAGGSAISALIRRTFACCCIYPAA